MNEHKNIITIEDEIKEFSDKPVKSSAIFKALQNSGGMPKDYPYTGQILFDGDVACADENGDLGQFESSAEQLLLTIDGVAHTLTWYEDGERWRNSDDNIEVGFGIDYCWLWVADLPDGTYAVILREAGIDSNFENAVNEVTGGGEAPSSELPLYFINYDNPPSREEIINAVYSDGIYGGNRVKVPIIYNMDGGLDFMQLPVLRMDSNPDGTWYFNYEYMYFQGQYSTHYYYHVEWLANGFTEYVYSEPIAFEQANNG